MHPWLMAHLPTYGACLLAGIVLAWLLARRMVRRAPPPLDAGHIDLLAPLLTAAGLGGAWLFGRWTDRLTGDAVHSAVLVGAMLGATTAGIGYALVQRIPLGRLGDLCAAPVAVAVACGRVGCFFAGCCYGKACDSWLGVRFSSESIAYADLARAGRILPGAAETMPLWPTQLIEAGACVVLAGLMALWARRIGRGHGVAGEAFLGLGIGYAAIRFVVEFWRGDNPAVWGPLTFSQGIALGIAGVAGITWVVRRRWRKRWGLVEFGKEERGAPLAAPRAR